MFTLSGFADEISPDLETQFQVLKDLGLRYVELRSVWDQNILSIDDAGIAKIQDALQKYDIRVSAIGSPIGKIKIDDPFEPHLRAFRRALELAERLGCRYIRLFSFYVPEGEADAYRGQVMERMRALLEEARGHDVVLLHENERHIYGDIPRRCRDLLQTLDSPQLRMTFDPANFIMCGVRPYSEAYPLVQEYVEYLHIKDGLLDDKRIVPAGQGDGEIRPLLRDLNARGWKGFLSLEPHLSQAGEFRGFSGPELFGVAVNALRVVLQELDIQAD
ncbi:MAG: sugar phosphate isomerase/epimerase [Chloroflexi bacterium]|nr:sugar phosphate isomerase/epimerase [Chloroflexota bacterium]